MHRLRREAKLNAWLDREDESTNYNPFRKYGRRTYPENRPSAADTSEYPSTTERARPDHVFASSDPNLPKVEWPGQEESSSHQDTLRRRATDIEKSVPAAKIPRSSSRTSIARRPISKPHNGLDRIETLGKESSIDEDNHLKIVPSRVESKLSEKPPPIRFTVSGQLRAIFLYSWINLLLLLVPAGFAVRYTLGYSVTTFVVNFFATIPLVLLVGLGADEIQTRVGVSLGLLINVTASNAAQFVSSVLLLKSNQVLVLQTGLIGGILCSVLLVLGLSFFLGGLNRMEQFYNLTMAHTSANMLSLASTSLIVPTVSQLLKQTSTENIIRQSRGASVLLVTVYAAFVVFQLHTHRDMLTMPIQKVPKRSSSKAKGDAVKSLASAGNLHVAVVGLGTGLEEVNDEADDIAFPTLSLPVAVATFILSTVLLTFNTDFAVNSIDQLSQDANISKNFIGLILLPLLNNVDPGPIIFAVKDRVTVTISITVGKCLQTALLVTPLMVLVAWCMGVDSMTLYFDGFEVASLFASVILLNYLIIDGKSTWIQGVLLIGDWGMIAIAAFFANT